MKVTVNGDDRRLADHATVAGLISSLGRDPSARGIAVAVNGEVVPRSSWDERDLHEDDRVELLEAVQGG